MKKLYVAVIWHMHQPLYRDRLTGRFLMPWVRLHALKDYLDMVLLLQDYPRIRQTFNLVPSLLEQLADYANGARDRALEVSLKPAASLTSEERGFILQRFFDLSSNQLNRFPRYVELATRRNQLLGEATASEAIEAFDDQDFTDLLVLFQLAWFDPRWLEEEPELAGLAKRGRGFTFHDQERIFEQAQQILRQVIPTYRAMAQRGQIELITSAYYHPILPLLCNTEIARESRPEIHLPSKFSHPEDAIRQVRRGLDYFESHFGFHPQGFWPPEQSLSQEVAGILVEQGLKWCVSDEGILARSLETPLERDSGGSLLSPETLYQPYWVETPAGRIAILFRDIVLSDLIGFSYSRLSGQQAAKDLIHRLRLAAERLPSEREHLVTIALDGENCWEYYPQDGQEFLQAFYGLASEVPELELTTVSEYLQAHPPEKALPRLHPGSWIYSDFSTWIGDPVKNRAWDLLKRVREDLVQHEASLEPWDRELAWEEIAIAEGSDWFWWFGDGHSSGQDEAFDDQFRLHLQTVYHFAGLPVPDFLQEPVCRLTPRPLRVPRIFWRPSIDGHSGRGWEQAATLDATGQKGTMHQALRIIQKVRHACDAHHLYLRMEFTPFFQRDPEDELLVYLCYPGLERINSPINLRPGSAEMGRLKDYLFAHELRISLDPLKTALSTAGECYTWHEQSIPIKSAFEEALEVALPFSALGISSGQGILFAIFFARQGTVAEVIPLDSLLTLTVPL